MARQRCLIVCLVWLLLGGLAVAAAPSAQAATAGLDVSASVGGPDRLPRGSTTEIQVVVRSTGSAAATNTELELTNAGTTLTSYVVSGAPAVSCAGSPVVCSLGSLAPGTVVTIDFTFQLPSTPGIFSFVPTVEADNAFDEMLDYYPQVIGGGVDLWLTMPSSISVDRQDPTFSLPVTITNVNHDEVASSTLTVSLPTGASYQGYRVSTGSATCTSSSTTVTCTTSAIGGVSSGSSVVELVLDLTAPRSLNSSVNGYVTAPVDQLEFSEFEPVPGEDVSNDKGSTSISVNSSSDDTDVSVSVSSQSTAQPGDVFNYYVTGRNQGSTVATNVVITAPIPVGASVRSTRVLRGSGSCSASASVVTCVAPSLVAGPGDEALLEFFVQLQAPSQFTELELAASIFADQYDFAPNNNAAVAVTRLVAFVSIGDAMGFEGDTGKPHALKFPVTLSRPLDRSATIYVRTSFGSAGADDVEAKTDVAITFKPKANGLTPVTKMLVVKLKPDVVPEGDERIGVSVLSTSTPVLEKLFAVASGTVLNDDPGSGQRMGIGRATVREGDEGAAMVSVPVTLAQPATDTVTARVTSGGGTALAGVDYKAVNKVITFKPGQQVKFVTVTVYWDRVDDAFPLLLLLTLSNVTGAAVQGAGVGTVTILDDD